MRDDQKANDRKSEGRVGGIGALVAALLLGAGRHADDIGRLVIRHGDDVTRAVMRHSDDITRLGMHHGDEVGRSTGRRAGSLSRSWSAASHRTSPGTGLRASSGGVEAGAKQAEEIPVGDCLHAAKLVMHGIQRCTRGDDCGR